MTENTIVKSQAQTIKNLLGSENAKKRFQELLGKKAAGFISSVISVTNGNNYLAKAVPQTILNSAVVAATLDLPINPNLGLAAIVPYTDRKTGITTAQFQLMYKGLIELCQRSGLFKSIIDEVVYDGQLVRKNKFTGEYEFDEDAKKSDVIIGYMAYFKLLNGFEKTAYMTKEEVERHAKRYSQSYKKGFGVWKDDFDVMARKTVLKLLLSKYAPKSIDIQRAINFDQAVIKDDLSSTEIDEAEVEYIDNQDTHKQLSEIAEAEEIKTTEKHDTESNTKKS